MKRPFRGREVFTVGHSTRKLSELVALLDAHGVRSLADIRTIPRSGFNPQFNKARLEKALPGAGIAYVHVPELGGLRKKRPDSPNGGWRNASFQGFADHMLTEEFELGLAKLLELETPFAIMCAEVVPWRCHRLLVADALLVRGAHVRDLTGATNAPEHKITPFAKVRGTRVIYPPAKT
jgi:uncharacterized protein (DUF488 family)